MAIERGAGAGGNVNGVSPELEQAEIDLIEFDKEKDITEFDDGTAIIGEFEEQTEIMQQPMDFNANLADFVDDGVLGSISNGLMGDIDDDMSSRKEWEENYKDGLSFLGMKPEDRSQPFEGASGVVHPLLAESVTQFQAQAYREMLPAGGPVRTQIIGAQNPMLSAQAERIKEYMNYQITYEMEEYDP